MPLEFSVDTDPASFGNHFIVGLSGTTLNEADKQILSTVKPAGVLLLKRNIDHSLPYPQWMWKLNELLEGVKQCVEREELLISIDHEGERVTRTPPPLTIFPNAKYFGAHAAEVATAQAIELRSIGVNLSWAPDADIHSNPANPIIGERAFGTTADQVIAGIVPYLDALQGEGVLGCAKHYPGHGDTATDSHLELPVLDLTIEELRERELKPFKALIEVDVPFIMTAHILFPKIDANIPATMSSHFVGDLLRKELGFKRVLITDDLDMKAVSKRFENGEMVVHALNVGCDMFIVARQPGSDDLKTITLAKTIASALQSHTLSEETLFKSFKRINGVFEDLLPMHKPHVLDQKVLDRHALLARKLAESKT